MLWTMLNVICFLICVVGAVGAAMNGGASPIGFAAAIGSGLVVGGGFAWAMWAVGEKVAAAAAVGDERRWEVRLRLLYLAAVIWILIAGFTADRLTGTIVRLTG